MGKRIKRAIYIDLCKISEPAHNTWYRLERTYGTLIRKTKKLTPELILDVINDQIKAIKYENNLKAIINKIPADLASTDLQELTNKITKAIGEIRSYAEMIMNFEQTKVFTDETKAYSV